MKRVLCILPDGFGGHGGIAQFNRDLLRALSFSPDVREIVALPRHVAHETGTLPAKLIFDISAAGSKAKYAYRLATLLCGDRDFDLIICTHINLQPFAWLAAHLTGAPSILVLHGVDAWTAPRSLMRRIAVQGADRYAAVSGVTLERFFAWAGNMETKASILPCCIDMERFTPGPPDPHILAKYGLDGKTPLLTLARLSADERYKGMDEVLEIITSLRQEIPNFVYVIAGHGDDRERLQAKARLLGVADAVRFTGYVPEADKLALYRAARGFVLAGRGEGFGIVLLEAMACGIPAIGSALDGSREAVRGGELGLVVDPRDKEALKRAIVDTLRRPVGIRPSGLDHFSFSAFAGRVDELLRWTVPAEA